MNSLSHLGTFFIIGLSGPSLSKEEAEKLSALQPGGVILFAKNFSDEEDWIPKLQTLLDDVKSACKRDRLFISIDHEGGRVHRFPSPVTRFPAARNWASQAREVGMAMGSELRALGFNLSFAPVLDVQTEPENEVIGVRAFSVTPEQVLRPAKEFIEGIEKAGILSCIKHFPGHGATIADSHIELPVLDEPKEILLSREIPPFASCFRTEPQLLMTAHVLYPHLDPDHPATMSRTIIEELLRGDLAYSGTVITDDLEMAALATFAPSERAVRCMEAGIDILLEGNPKTGVPADYALEMAKGLEDARTSGRISENRFEDSRARIQHLKEYLSSIQNSNAPCALEVLSSEDHRRLLSDVS